VAHISYHLEHATDEVLSLGVMRFKMDRWFEFGGYKPAHLNGQELPTMKLKTHFGEEVRMIHLQGGFAPQAIALARQYQDVWNQRILIAGMLESQPEDHGKIAA